MSDGVHISVKCKEKTMAGLVSATLHSDVQIKIEYMPFKQVYSIQS